MSDSVAAAKFRLDRLDDVFVAPRRGREGDAEAQRHGEPRDVRAGEDEAKDRRAVGAVAEIGPVTRREEERGRSHREGDRPEGQLGKNVPELNLR